jgi:regulator of protease activity HflC (stomatin/prohibitin superfamily)
MSWKIGLLVSIVGLGLAFEAWLTTAERPQVMEAALAQLDGDGNDTVRIEQMHQTRSLRRIAIAVVAALAVLELVLHDVVPWLTSAASKWVSAKPATGAKATAALCLLAVLPLTAGCWRPFEPVELQTISPNEEAFLLPLTDDVKRQTSTNNEEYLKQNLVYTKQVRIPQQWVPKGYEYLAPNGKWQNAAILVKVDKSPVTREWTADSNSGTSNKNEAIWVMTSDQVEFSTGWTCTARIASRDDAVRFLHNYPNGSLKDVLDTEVRGKLQATFGLEVTDQPMTKLRQEATPHILRTTKEVCDFFKDRGVTITNLGITGGFIYKDKSIMDTMVRVFNAEQEKAVATAGFQAQEETNKAVFAEAEGRAKALILSKQAEADSIKLVADAKSYEIDKAKMDSEMYVQLKRLEIERDKLQKWDGRFPTYFIGAAKTPDMLLQMPVVKE